MRSKIFTSITRLSLLALLFVFLFFPDKWQLTFNYPGYPQADSPKIRFSKTAFWLLLTLEVLRIFYYGIIRCNKKGVFSNLVTVLITLFVTVALLEILFMYIPQSHEGVVSKASQIWWQRYWNPVNSLGFRDREVLKDKGKKRVLVIGDSFAAGHGLNSIDERFSNILEQQLGADRYSVYNFGVSGADTRDEAKRLSAAPIKPDIIILQYFPNDIEKVGREKGLSLSGAEPYSDINGIASSIVNRFYLPNYIYWQLPHTAFSTFEEFVKKAYTDTTVLHAHLRDVSEIIAYRDSTKAEMYAVFIPFLFQMDKSAVYTKPVEDYLKANGVTVVPVNEGISRIPAPDRVVGKNDGHASAAVNKIIAEHLYQAIRNRQ